MKRIPLLFAFLFLTALSAAAQKAFVPTVTVSDFVGTAPHVVSFQVTADKALSKVTWEIGSKIVSSSPAFSYTFTAVGTEQVTMTAYSAKGQKSVQTVEIQTLAAADTSPPTTEDFSIHIVILQQPAAFGDNAPRGAGIAPFALFFGASGSEQIDSYDWQIAIGDGDFFHISNLTQVLVTFGAPNTYKVKLIATHGSDTATDTLVLVAQ